MITFEINKRKKKVKNKLYFSINKNGGSIQNIVWIFVVQAFLLFIPNFLDAFHLFFLKIKFIFNEIK